MNSNKIILLLLLVSVSIIAACNGNEAPLKQSTEIKLGMDNSASENAEQIATADGNEHSSLESTSSVNQTDRIARAQQDLLARLESTPQSSTEMRYRVDIEPYLHFTDSDGYLNLNNVEIREIDKVLGAAPVVIKQSRDGAPIRREVRVYMPYDEDPTGLYIYFLNDRVQSFRMDEFNGITNSSLLDYFK
jgi:hypothetical protein